MRQDCNAGGKTAGTIVQGFQSNDTTAAAHAIASSTPNGQASDTLGQLYAQGKKMMSSVGLCRSSEQSPDTCIIHTALSFYGVPSQHATIGPLWYLVQKQFHMCTVCLMLQCFMLPAAANNTGLESDLAKKSADTMSQASKFNLDAAAIAFYNGATSAHPSLGPSCSLSGSFGAVTS